MFEYSVTDWVRLETGGARRKQDTYKVYVFFKGKPGAAGEDEATRQRYADEFLKLLIGVVIGEDQVVDSPDLAVLINRNNATGMRIPTINLSDLPASGVRGAARLASGSLCFTTFASLWFTCCSLLVHSEPKMNQK